MQNFKFFVWGKKSQIETWFANLHLNSLDFIRFASFFGIGFLCGLFFKKWSKYIIIVGLSVSIALAILQSCGCITINFATIGKLIGWKSITSMQEIFFALMTDAQKYSLELGCSGIGFMLGFKTG